MPGTLSRRTLLAGGAMFAQPRGPVIDTHIHLFDDRRFPYHPNAPYKPPPSTLEDYSAFVREAKIDHTVIVHPEPYQDDHRYLEYCFAHEPSPGFFKGTCLFDPIDPATPKRMAALVKKNPKRIVALRIHTMRAPGTSPAISGAIKDRDLRSPAVKATVREAGALGLAIQMHFVPANAREIGDLMDGFRDVAVVLDHLGRPAQGKPEEWKNVLALARLPRAHMKFSGWSYIKDNLEGIARRAYDAFGPDRIVWGGLGMNRADYERNKALLEETFSFTGEAERAKIRGINAARLYAF